MTETSVIKHYKKQLIYRQHDLPEQETSTKETIAEIDLKNNNNTKDNKIINNGKRIRKKRKNKNCRGQFRHEAMELIKLGASPSHSLCKTKEPFKGRPDRPPDPTKDEPPLHQMSVRDQTIILSNPPPSGHTLPQMVPERRSSREYQQLPPKPPERRTSIEYQHPPPKPPTPQSHPPPKSTAPPMYLPPEYRSYFVPYSPPCRSPPYQAPRPPVRPIPQHAPYTGIHFSMQPHHNDYQPFATDRRKRKHSEEEKVVAAIDLTMDQEKKEKIHPKCHCECGKTYPSNTRTQDVTIKVAEEKDSSTVPSAYLSGKMVNGVLRFDNQKEGNLKKGGTTMTEVPEGKPPQQKLRQLFLIEDLLAKGEKLSKKPSHHRIPERGKPNDSVIVSDKNSRVVPIRSEPNRVIVSPNHQPRPKPKDYSLIDRRQSTDIDTISISSSSSESVRSPRPKSNTNDKQIPQGKLFYYKINNSFIRYFDDTQKKLFWDNLIADGTGYEIKHNDYNKEVIELPKTTVFSSRDSLTVEEYVCEMTLVEKYIPRDFFLFYKFVTGYQICNNNNPVSFLTFLKLYNTNRLKILLERYINSLKMTV